MAKGNSLDAQLKRLSEWATEPDSEAFRQELRRGLQASSNVVVAKAAEIVGERELAEFLNDLRSLWEPLCAHPDRDRGCRAKTAILDALARLDFDDPDFCLAGLKYEQIDPGYPPADSAINVRGGCAQLLARSWRIGLTDKLIALTELLADPERTARVHAVNAIADVGHECVIPLLRVKAQCGDRSGEVVGACFSALLHLAKENSVPFVAQFLHRGGDIAREAAAALGEFGLPDAISRLIETWKHTSDRDFQEDLLSSLGLSRQPLAVDFLVAQLKPVTHFSEPALRALAPLRFYPELRERVRVAVESSKHARLRAIFSELFHHASR